MEIDPTARGSVLHLEEFKGRGGDHQPCEYSRPARRGQIAVRAILARGRILPS